MELTPELFEKIEFTERRRGYDTEQVETFLEEAGTALAQMLVRVRHTEERAAAAEARLGESDSRISAAEERAARAEAQARQATQAAQAAQAAAAERSAAPAAQTADDEVEVQQAGRVLAMAKRTADDVVAEARTQAQQVVGESKARADRQLAEAQAEAEELIRRARSQADSEFAERRQRAQEDVQALEIRRSQLGDIITQLEARLAGYRQDLSRTAEELTLLASDPDRLGARPNLAIPPDEVLRPEPADEAPQEMRTVDHQPAEASAPDVVEGPQGATDDGGAAGEDDPDPGPATQAMDAAVVVGDEPGDEDGSDGGRSDGGRSDEWEPGSWSRLATSGAADDQPEVEISLADEPVTGSQDRFLRELDEAVNDTGPEDDAMTAFFEGNDDSRTRRFGWRR